MGAGNSLAFTCIKSECLGHPRRGSKGFKRLVRDTICFSVSGAFDVDSTLDFDLDHIAGVGGLPPDVTSGTDLLAVSGLGAGCLLYTSPSPRDATLSRMPSSA